MTEKDRDDGKCCNNGKYCNDGVLQRMITLGELYTFSEESPYAQKSQKAHKRIKTKAVLNAPKKRLSGRMLLVQHKNHKTYIKE